MSGTPTDVLIARALHFMELGLLQLKNGSPTDAMLSLETAKKCLEKLKAMPLSPS